MIEDDILELQNDRIRALEMVVGVMAKVIDATGNNVLNVLREVIDRRLDELEAADQLPGDSGGASRRSLRLARTILDEAPRRLKAACPAKCQSLASSDGGHTTGVARDDGKDRRDVLPGGPAGGDDAA